MRLHAPLLFTLTVLLAGCSSPSPDGDGTDLSTTMTGTSGAAGPASPIKAPEPLPVTVTCTQTRTNVGTTTGYGLNLDRAALGLDFCMLDDLFDGNTSWAQAGLVETTWKSQPTQTGTDLWFESDACQPALPPDCTPPHTMGSSSPLSLALTAEQLRTAEGKNPSVMASGQGFVNDLEYTFYITLFPTTDVPSGFTAIP